MGLAECCEARYRFLNGLGALGWVGGSLSGIAEIGRLEVDNNLEQVTPLEGEGVEGLALEGGKESADPGGIFRHRKSGLAFINASLY